MVKHDFFRYAVPYIKELLGDTLKEDILSTYMNEIFDLENCDQFSSASIIFSLPAACFSLETAIRRLIDFKVLSSKKSVAAWKNELLENLTKQPPEFFNASKEQHEMLYNVRLLL